MQERLDRVLATDVSTDRFISKVQHIPYSSSDHLPIYLEVKKFVIRRTNGFRFENQWVGEAECGRIIQYTWKESEGSDIKVRLQRCAEKLELWGSSFAKQFRGRIQETKRRIGWLKGRLDASSIWELCEDEKELQKLLKQEEDFWAQRGKLF